MKRLKPFNSLLFTGVIGLASLKSWGSQVVHLDGNAGGKAFDGIGAVSGGGATSVLLKDYPEPERSQILDLLFKPKFGASMSTLLVEVPGDGNSTQGSETSHKHTRNDANFFRGYEWWLMREAKNRNPNLTLDACAWGCPGWVGNGKFWSQDMCDYYADWILGLKTFHGMDLTAIGCRNERGVNEGFAKMLRTTLDARGLQNVRIHGFDNWGKNKFDWAKDLETDEQLRDAISILSNHTMSEVSTPPDVRALAEKFSKPIWNTEEHVYKKGFDCEISLVKAFNENFISSGVTKIVNWYLVASLYPLEPYSEDPSALVANSPWSGFYHPREVLWGYAHYGQFSKIGWNYLNGACGKLDGGGTFVTLKSPDEDYSIILETKDAKSPQIITFKLYDGLSNNKLCVWRSDAHDQFLQLDSIVPASGEFSIELEPRAIYSLSTTSGQRKGAFTNIPAAKAFPFPYRETFDKYVPPEKFGWQAQYLADIDGVFEIATRPDGQGQCLRQVLQQKAQEWAPGWRPYTILGDAQWRDYEISVDIFLDDGGWAGILGRVCNVGDGYGCAPKGYYVRLAADGGCALVLVNGKAGVAEAGDLEHQAALRAEKSSGTKGEKILASCTVPAFDTARWHNVKLQFSGEIINCMVDGKQMLTATNAYHAQGMAGLITGDLDRPHSAYFDNLTINAVGAPATDAFANSPQEIYHPAR